MELEYPLTSPTSFDGLEATTLAAYAHAFPI